MSAPQTFPNAQAANSADVVTPARPAWAKYRSALIGPQLSRSAERGRAAPYHGWPL